MYKLLFIFLTALIIGGGYYYYQNTFSLDVFNSQDSSDSLGFWVGAKVDQDDLLSGCPFRDCIESIDSPEFESVSSANDWLDDEEIVFGINRDGVVRVYPQKILNRHEIVNDVIADQPIMITFCPLCGTAISFERVVNGEVTTFGVSGKLHNSDLVMYDRLEENYWQQVTGEAIVGSAARRDEYLEIVSTATTTWGEWKEEHPTTQVLSRPKLTIDYNYYPYGDYESNEYVGFRVDGLEDIDTSISRKEVVYGIVVDGQAKAYTEDILRKRVSFEDVVGHKKIVISWESSGEVTFINAESGEEYIPLRSFWFAWAAFNPETLLLY